MLLLGRRQAKTNHYDRPKVTISYWLFIIRVPPEVLIEKYLVRVLKIFVSTSTSATGAVRLSQVRLPLSPRILRKRVIGIKERTETK